MTVVWLGPVENTAQAAQYLSGEEINHVVPK